MRYAGEETELALLIEEAMRRDLELALFQQGLMQSLRRSFTSQELQAFKLPGWDPDWLAEV